MHFEPVHTALQLFKLISAPPRLQQVFKPVSVFVMRPSRQKDNENETAIFK